jgi:hypothetical protein
LRIPKVYSWIRVFSLAICLLMFLT